MPNRNDCECDPDLRPDESAAASASDPTVKQPESMLATARRSWLRCALARHTRVIDPPKALLPDQSVEEAQTFEDAQFDEWCRPPGRPDALEGPDGRLFSIDSEQLLEQRRTRIEIDGNSLLGAGFFQTDVGVRIQDERAAEGQADAPQVLGFSPAADAVTATASDLQITQTFDLCVGARLQRIEETRTVSFLTVTAFEGGEQRRIRLYDRYRQDPELGERQPVILLRQRAQKAGAPGVADYVHLVFDGEASLSAWRENPGLILYRTATDSKFGTTTTRSGDVDGPAVAPGDAPAVPPLTAPPVRVPCKKRRERKVDINDFGHSQSRTNRVRFGIPGMINVSSVNDMIEKIKRVIREQDCECIKELNFFGHGASGTQSVGAGQGWDAARELGAGNVALLGQQLGPLMCPDACVTFYGCNVGDGPNGPAFLQALATALGAKTRAWTGRTAVDWDTDKDGNITNVAHTTSGNQVVRRP